MTTDSVPSPADLWMQAGQTWMDGWAALAGQPATGDGAPADPFRLWQRSFDQWLEGWSALFEQTLSRPETAEASGRLLDALLNIQKPLREQTATTMQYWLEFWNMPTRREQIRTAKQLNDVTDRLDEVQEQLWDLADRLADRTDDRNGVRPAVRETGGTR